MRTLQSPPEVKATRLAHRVFLVRELGIGLALAVLIIGTAIANPRFLSAQSVKDLLSCHAVLSRRLIALIHDIEKLLQDLVAFVPLWLEAVENRRALLLKRNAEEKGENGRGLPNSDEDLEALLG